MIGSRFGLPPWAVVVPPVAAVPSVATWGREPSVGPLLVGAGLVAAVMAAVHHA